MVGRTMPVKFVGCLTMGIVPLLFTISCSEAVKSSESDAKVSGLEGLTADQAYREMVSTEEIIRELTPSIIRLRRAVSDLALPGHEAVHLFAPAAQVVDIDITASHRSDPDLPIQHRDVTIKQTAFALNELKRGIWAALWDEVEYFEDVRFGVIRGRKLSPAVFETKLKFSGRSRSSGQQINAWSGYVIASWQRDANESQWKITRWETVSMSCLEASRTLFRDVLPEALPGPSEVERARTSIHEGYLRDVFFTGATTFAYPKDYWIYVLSWDSLDQHTSVSVVDIDQDGWDDFYVTARWGRNQLWRNRRDGTFEDIAPRVGLDIDGVCNCALFADFDNDGDQDVFIGRSLERSLYLINRGGRFENSPSLLDGPLPYWASALAAADVDQDGLLDLYISTYRLPISKPTNILAHKFLDEKQRREFIRRRGEDHPVFRLSGPPNVLLLNQGNGRFNREPQAGGADLWLNSFQGTWSDYDNDGDPDLFVANDYAPDHVFRNDSGHLVDATADLAGDELQGFGMGVSLGDYDNDGLQDPYFTYMYSKAGTRITEMFEGLERRMYEGVTGNKLLRNTPEGFRNVSGDGPGQMQVMKAGWSWGGQFGDIDNDGFLDLYVANGLYTPPPGTATEVDL